MHLPWLTAMSKPMHEPDAADAYEKTSVRLG
jgi:hypothetical protein